MAEGKATEFVERIEPETSKDSTRATLMGPILADAYVILGQAEKARYWYGIYLDQLPSYARNAHALVLVRRAIADQARLMQVLYSPAQPKVRAQKLSSMPIDAHGLMLAALLYAEDEDYQDAVALLEQVVFNEALLSQRTLVWLARFQYYLGSLDDAIQYAILAQASVQAAEPDEAALLSDFLDHMRWLQGQVRMEG
jgi:tetratricopeptide (TPR) repeat protein